MKKLLNLLLIAMLLLAISTSLVACDDFSSEPDETTTAADGGQDAPPVAEGELEFTLNGDGQSYSVAIGTYTGLDIVIPATYEGKPVTAVANNAFKNCKTITSVTIPEGVKTIGSYAFGDCRALTEIVVPDSVETIARHAFYNCKALESITLPFVGESAETTTNTHFGYIFGAKDGSANSTFIPEALKNIVIKSGTVIADDAFSGCKNLETISLPEGITSIGDDAFKNCIKLESITIEDGVMSIGKHAFDNCSSLLSITVPNSVTSIGFAAFMGCDNIAIMSLPFIGTVANGTENTHLGYLFGAEDVGNTKHFISSCLTQIVVTGSANIPHNAFENCGCINTIIISGDVTSIGEEAFYYCYNLTNVVIPSSVTSIGAKAAYGAAGIYNVYYEGTEAAWKNITIAEGNENLLEDDETTIYYFSAEEPTAEGNFWHYVDGVPTAWEASAN